MNLKEKYRNNIEILTSIGYPLDHIHEIEGTTGEKEYFEIFAFYQSNLEHNYKNFQINPTLWYLIPSPDINAIARKSRNYFTIGTNNGVIDFLFVNFKNNPHLLMEGQELEPYRELESLLETPFHILMYQASLHFTFYHEMGHLVQFSKRSSSFLMMEEQASANEKFDMQNHIDEIDADTFSCMYASEHVFQYIEDYYSKSPSNDDIVKIISLITTALSLYLLSFPSYSVNFYLKKYRHPHVMIRILNLIDIALDSFIILANKKRKPIKTSKDKIIKEAIDLVALLEPRLMKEIDLGMMREALNMHGKDMEKYLNILRNRAYEDENSAWRQKNKLGAM